MALDLKTVVVQQSNGTQILLFDNTGNYDINNNPGGWNSPNAVRTDVTEITITIKKGDIEYVRVLTGSFITDYLDPSIGATFNSTDVLGANYDRYEDGLYQIQVEVVEPVLTHYDNKYEYLLWIMWDQIRQLTLTMEVPIINYLESYNISLLNALFDDILFACQYGQTTYATEIYTFLKNVLDNETVLTELFKNFRNYAS